MHLQINVYIHKDAQMVFMPEKKRSLGYEETVQSKAYMITTILRVDSISIIMCGSRESAELI